MRTSMGDIVVLLAATAGLGDRLPVKLVMFYDSRIALWVDCSWLIQFAYKSPLAEFDSHVIPIVELTGFSD